MVKFFPETFFEKAADIVFAIVHLGGQSFQGDFLTQVTVYELEELHDGLGVSGLVLVDVLARVTIAVNVSQKLMDQGFLQDIFSLAEIDLAEFFQ